jgi:hypothetical protein
MRNLLLEFCHRGASRQRKRSASKKRRSGASAVMQLTRIFILSVCGVNRFAVCVGGQIVTIARVFGAAHQFAEGAKTDRLDFARFRCVSNFGIHQADMVGGTQARIFEIIAAKLRPVFDRVKELRHEDSRLRREALHRRAGPSAAL